MSEEKQKPEEVYTAENAEQEADTIFGSSLTKTDTQKSGGLSKNAKWLLIGGIALILLGGGLTAVLLTSDREDISPEDSTLSVDEKIALNPSNAEDVTGIDVQDAEPFTVKRSTDGTYGIVGLEDVTMDAALLSTLVNNGSELEADSLVEENAADLTVYGLADTAAEVTMHYADGTDFAFRVGDAAPMGNAQTYCEIDGDVYLVRTSLVANFRKTPDKFVSTVVLAEPSDEDYPIVDSVRIERDDLDYDIYLEYDYEGADDDSTGGVAATHVMREPLFSYLSVDKSVAVTNGMFGLTALEIVDVHPTDKALADAGLDEPFCTVEMQCTDGNTYHLAIGEAYEASTGTACYYAKFEDVPLIYGLTSEDAAWARIQPGDITSANIFVSYVWDIGTLDIQVGDEDFRFEGKGTEQADYEVTKNGETCDTERFRLLYRFLLNIYGEELYFGELPDSAPQAEVHLTSQDGKEDYTVSFYKQTDLKTIIARDGVPSYVVRTSCLNTLLHNLEIFDDLDTPFQETWQ
ncbi:MAG: DUF4340 domain-containing protein [Oscillospiraceae bacterium]|nr:DUF4340 domain-containing protein [Oscillospiraceae bacterium]